MAEKQTKFIFVTGGVVSGLGKGITAASLGRLLKCRGLKVASQKLDDTYSDHIATYVRWMSVLTYWMLIFGIGCSVLTFLFSAILTEFHQSLVFSCHLSL